MGKTETEVVIFIIIFNLILLIFISGIIVFVGQYRKRKILYAKEKELLNQIHRQELLSNQVEIQLQTMQDIGREIHDNVGQKLTLAAIYSQQIAHADQYPELSEKVEIISKLLNESLKDLRQLSKSLVQPPTVQGDLITLLQDEAKQINQTGFFKLQIKSDESKIDLGLSTRNAIFRLLQEFIQNSLKHSKCKNIVIDIQNTAQKLYISIEDDGIGFDLKIQKEGIGLSNMKRRAAEIGCNFNFESTQGQGTKLSIMLELWNTK